LWQPPAQLVVIIVIIIIIIMLTYAQFKNNWKGELRGQLANPGSLGKWSVCISVCITLKLSYS